MSTSTPQHHIHTEELSAYLDGMLDEQDRAAIASHLATCAECRTETDALRVTVRLLGELPQYQPRHTLQLGMEFANRRSPDSSIVRFLPIVRSLSVAAVLVFMVAAGAFFLGGSTDDVDQPTSSRSAIQGETGGNAEASQGSGNTGAAESGAQPDRVSEAPGDGRLIDRGDAATSGDDPLADLTSLEQSETSAEDQASETSLQSRLTADFGQAFLVGVGILALVLVSLWLVLARIEASTRRSAHRSHV